MSGIAGIIGKNASSEKVARMLDTIKHRGPDGQWIGDGDSYALGVCTAALGPEKSSGQAQGRERIALFDGEIYNPRAGGDSDVEIVARAYEDYGRTFAAHLQGAFACAIWDHGKLILARDPVGIRPLYWGFDEEGTLFFASELKALVGMVCEVRELPPSTVFCPDTGIQTYLPVHPFVPVPDAVDEARGALRGLLFRATERRLSDGAVGGMLLSGGLDSSIIAAIANEIQPGLRAFTVGIEGAPDLKNAAVMAAHLGVPHEVELFGAEEIKTLIPEAVYALESFDEDCVSGTIANLVASRWAHTHTNCILSGEGGDELNGGYLLLKELPDDEARRQMMEKLIAVAYNTALQRLDRAMMCNSINYRTPFLDSEVIAFCLQLPVSWKVHDVGGGHLVEKWLLREAFKDMLPEEIYRREKLRFSGGTGTDALIEEKGDEIVPPEKMVEGMTHTSGGYRLNSPKESYYYRLFQERFPGPHFESLVGRWDPDK